MGAVLNPWVPEHTSAKAPARPPCCELMYGTDKWGCDHATAPAVDLPQA